MTELALVRPDELESAWPLVLPWLTPALWKGGYYGAEDVKAEVEKGTMQLWLAYGPEVEAIAVTKLVDYPKCREFTGIVLTGRERARWQDYIATGEAWAKANGATRATYAMRPGWERVLNGYQKTHVVLERQL